MNGSDSDKDYEIQTSGEENLAVIPSLEAELAKIQGLVHHQVDGKNHKVRISPDSAELIAKSVSVIRESGLKVDTSKKTFPVQNMSCASCAVSVESMVKSQKGVVSASVNFADNTLKVEYLHTVKPVDLKHAVQSIGYDLVTDEKKDTSEVTEDLANQKLKTLRFRTAGAVLFSIPLIVLGMFFMDSPYSKWMMWALATPVVLFFGREFFINAWKQLKHGSANMDTLVALSTGISYLFSVFNTLYPSFWLKKGLDAHVYFEAASVVIAFILLGRYLEEKAKGNTAGAIKKLIGLRPETVNVIHDGGHVMTMPVSQVIPGQKVMIRPGDRIPVDGTVDEGESYVDESMLTGEPIPVVKTKGKKVFAGTLNQKGSFVFVTDKVGSETVLSRIIEMVREAQGSKAPVQKTVDRIASIFVPVVMGIALLSFFIWWGIGGPNGFSHGLLAMVTVLVIACPCALGLATPTAIMVGIGKAAEKGILIKDAEGLETIRKTQVIVLDKTGTITEGKPTVSDIYKVKDDPGYIPVLVSMELRSEHPLAEAVVKYFPPAEPLPLTAFDSFTGKGISAVYNGVKYFAGNRALMVDNHINIPIEVYRKTAEWTEKGQTVIWFSDDAGVLMVIGISDQLKTSSIDAIKALTGMGLEVMMLTGDGEKTAAGIAAQVGIKNFRAEVLPSAKADIVNDLRKNGKVVAMVGDGINDSAALAAADVSIAMGKGSDIAMDTALMTIVSSDLTKIPVAMNISRLTVKTLRQNLFWAFIYNIIGIPLAAGVLFPITGYQLNPMIAGAAMALSSVSVVSNSIRLKWKRINLN